MIDPLEVESVRKSVPIRRLVSEDLGASGDFQLGEAHTLGFVPENVCQRATLALPNCDDAAAVMRAVSFEAPVNAVGARIRRANVASDIGAVDLDRSREHEAVCLTSKGFPDLVGENERRLVRYPCASRQLKNRHALGAVDQNGDRTEQVDKSELAGCKDRPARELN